MDQKGTEVGSLCLHYQQKNEYSDRTYAAFIIFWTAIVVYICWIETAPTHRIVMALIIKLQNSVEQSINYWHIITKTNLFGSTIIDKTIFSIFVIFTYSQEFWRTIQWSIRVEVYGGVREQTVEEQHILVHV